jgi:hypothetical protein
MFDVLSWLCLCIRAKVWSCISNEDVHIQSHSSSIMSGIDIDLTFAILSTQHSMQSNTMGEYEPHESLGTIQYLAYPQPFNSHSCRVPTFYHP